jgi:hypothetical protein
VVERRTGTTERHDLGGGFTLVTGPAIFWEYCECPWWHRLPFIRSRVHDSLP